MQYDLLKKILTSIDLTSLNDADTNEKIASLCKNANTPFGHVAAVCVYPQFIHQVKELLQETRVKLATVANFPSGTEELNHVVLTLQQAINSGAQEVDIVFPYREYLSGKIEKANNFIKKCKAVCGEKILLKVILETGMFDDQQKLTYACRDAILAGADFLKTSTGKISIGATLSAATVILMTIKNMSSEIDRCIGFKASGGIRTIEQASEYIALANEIMGLDWVTPRTFRIGASQLCDLVISELEKSDNDKND